MKIIALPPQAITKAKRIRFNRPLPSIDTGILREQATKVILEKSDARYSKAEPRAVMALGGVTAGYGTGGGGGSVSGRIIIGSFILPESRDPDPIFAFFSNKYDEELDNYWDREGGRTWMLGFEPITRACLRYQEGDSWHEKVGNASSRDFARLVTCLKASILSLEKQGNEPVPSGIIQIDSIARSDQRSVAAGELRKIVGATDRNSEDLNHIFKLMASMFGYFQWINGSIWHPVEDQRI